MCIRDSTKYNASAEETLNLVVPSSAQPLAPEFQRLATDMEKGIGGVANLAQAQENAGQQDLTLLNQSTNWDARLPALGALAAQQAQTTGIDQQALYAMSVSYTHLYPFGSTSYQAGDTVADAGLKRYRYIGKERDQETGLYYCRTRYYACWIARWISADPKGIDGGIDLYEYGKGNPVAVSYTHLDVYKRQVRDRKSTRLNSSHVRTSRMPSSA